MADVKANMFMAQRWAKYTEKDENTDADNSIKIIGGMEHSIHPALAPLD